MVYFATTKLSRLEALSHLTSAHVLPICLINDCDEEVRDSHEATCSAAPVAQNEFCLSSAIANQTQGQVEQDYFATLLVENSVSGVEIKTVDEGESSAAPVTSAEKWSHEAIVARPNMRPVRREKLLRLKFKYL